jgi:anti-sigma B factor antagonist
VISPARSAHHAVREEGRQMCVSLCLSYSEECVMSNVNNFVDRFGVLEVRDQREGDRHVIALNGEFDLDGVPHVDEQLRRAEATGARQIVLDLTGLEFMDSSGIRLILEAQARSRAAGNRLVLTCGPGPVQRLFDLTDVTSRLPFTS